LKRTLSNVDTQQQQQPSPTSSTLPSGSDDDSDVPQDSPSTLMERFRAARASRAPFLAMPISPFLADSPATSGDENSNPEGQRRVAWNAPSPVLSPNLSPEGSPQPFPSTWTAEGFGETTELPPGVTPHRRNSDHRRALVAALKREEADRYERLYKQKLADDSQRKAKVIKAKRAIAVVSFLSYSSPLALCTARQISTRSADLLTDFCHCSCSIVSLCICVAGWRCCARCGGLQHASDWRMMKMLFPLAPQFVRCLLRLVYDSSVGLSLALLLVIHPFIHRSS
jgi:hypothetical protein